MLSLFKAFIPQAAVWEADSETTRRHNTNILYWEIAFAAVLGGIVTFNSTYAVRLGASKELVALLSSMPALVAALLSIPTALFVQARQHREMWLFASLLVARVGHIVLVFLPLLFPVRPAEWLVFWVIALNLPIIFFTNGFQALLAELLPPAHRSKAISRRTMIWSMAIVVTTAIGGIWLDSVPFPLNFQLMYGFGVAISLLSQRLLSRLHIPDRMHSGKTLYNPTAKAEPVHMTKPIKRMLINMGVYLAGVHLPQPLFIIFYVEALKASNTWIGINAAVGSFGVVVGFYIWERLLRHHDLNWGLRRAALMTWVFPVGVALFPELTLIVFFNFLVNAFHPGFELTSLNLMMKMGDEEHRTVYMSWFNTMLNACVFAAPLFGVWVAGYIGIPAVFLLSGALRVAGGLLFCFNKVQDPEDTTAYRPRNQANPEVAPASADREAAAPHQPSVPARRSKSRGLPRYFAR
jgi:predicted MFS family arabinose efflux permease